MRQGPVPRNGFRQETTIQFFLMHGQIDSNIPARHSHRIQSRNPKAVLWEVPKADHCGAISAAPKEFEQRLLAWFSKKPATEN
jgi:pimeloyl-ACP methyl ester carboxylesterase